MNQKHGASVHRWRVNRARKASMKWWMWPDTSRQRRRLTRRLMRIIADIKSGREKLYEMEPLPTLGEESVMVLSRNSGLSHKETQ